MEEHLDGLAEQLQSVETQKQTLVSLASEEVRLKYVHVNASFN